MGNAPTKVLVIDDSALVRQMLSELLGTDPDLEVVGTAQDPYQARDKIKALKPDVLTLDVEMPRMDGLTFLANLMRLHPLPVVMVSSLTERGARTTLEALDLGAVDFVSKPKVDLAHTLQDYTEELIAKVKAAAAVRFRAAAPAGMRSHGAAARTGVGVVPYPATAGQRLRTTDSIIAIGASTGGTEAIRVVLQALPPHAPGIVISQHIPAMFSGPFAERMNCASQMTVSEARDGQQVVPGHVYIAPGNRHLIVERSGARYICRLSDAAPVNRHRPSVDVMFRSVAENVGANTIGILLTGMGTDGAAGLKAIHDAGGPTIAQDEKSSIVWGMPGEAVRLGGADDVLALERIARRALGLASRAPHETAAVEAVASDGAAVLAPSIPYSETGR